MNRRIPRLMLLVVLLLSMLAVFQMGGDATNNLAQGPSDNCGLYSAYDDGRDSQGLDTALSELGTPAADGAYQVDSIFQVPADDQDTAELTLIELTLFTNREISLLSAGNSILRIDSGEVTLVNCNADSDIGTMFVQVPGQEGQIEVKPGDAKLVEAGSAIFVRSSDVYFLWEGNHELDASLSGVQQLSNELSTDALPNQIGTGAK